jgi:hypothetical protein
MKDYSFLKPGLVWARPKRQSFEVTPYAWCIVEILGFYPFLESTILVEMNGPTKSITSISNPNDWEFGPEVNVPSKDWQYIPDEQS